MGPEYGSVGMNLGHNSGAQETEKGQESSGVGACQKEAVACVEAGLRMSLRDRVAVAILAREMLD